MLMIHLDNSVYDQTVTCYRPGEQCQHRCIKVHRAGDRSRVHPTFPLFQPPVTLRQTCGRESGWIRTRPWFPQLRFAGDPCCISTTERVHVLIWSVPAVKPVYPTGNRAAACVLNSNIQNLKVQNKNDQSGV